MPFGPDTLSISAYCLLHFQSCSPSLLLASQTAPLCNDKRFRHRLVLQVFLVLQGTPEALNFLRSSAIPTPAPALLPTCALFFKACAPCAVLFHRCLDSFLYSLFIFNSLFSLTGATKHLLTSPVHRSRTSHNVNGEAKKFGNQILSCGATLIISADLRHSWWGPAEPLFSYTLGFSASYRQICVYHVWFHALLRALTHTTSPASIFLDAPELLT